MFYDDIYLFMPVMQIKPLAMPCVVKPTRMNYILYTSNEPVSCEGKDHDQILMVILKCSLMISPTFQFTLKMKPTT